MDIWLEWYRCVALLRPACSYSATYMWMVLALAGLCTRTEHLGVTSIIRALGLQERCYHRLLHMFHSRSLKLELLTKLWIELVRTLFRPLLVSGYYVLVVDGLKVAKEGKKMPAVKKLYQGSNDNSKPAYIFGIHFKCSRCWCRVFQEPFLPYRLFPGSMKALSFPIATKGP